MHTFKASQFLQLFDWLVYGYNNIYVQLFETSIK